MALITVQRSPTPSVTSSPCVSEAGSGEEERRSQPRSISESFLTVKGAALFLPRGNGSFPSPSPHSLQRHSKHAGDLQQHLQTMFTLLRPEDYIRLAVCLESARPRSTRYMVVVSTNGRQDTEESLVLGLDFSSTDSSCSMGLVLPLWSDTLIHLDGDGGFTVSTVNRVHVFKPVSVQAMWSALQSLHKACEVARCHNYYPGSLFLTWVSYYQSRVTSDQASVNEWNALKDVQSHRADSPVLFTDVPTEGERTERRIKMRLREIMMQKDLENITSKEIRTELEMQMGCNLREFKEFIDNEMIIILGQMDRPTEIFDHVYLGSEWNASNLEELQNSGVRFILNVTREIDNFFPSLFEYHNIRVYDEEATDLLAFWNDTYKFITKAKKAGAKCLVHCKMGVSRSASTVIAYAMKEYGWDLAQAFGHVKERRPVTKPNPSFMKQLEEYQGILLASKQRHNKLWRSHSDGDLSDRREPPCRTPHTLGRSDPHNDSINGPPSLENILGMGMAGQQALESDFLPPSCSCDLERSLSVQEDPFLLRLSRPRAATVVPAEGMDETSITVAVMVPVMQHQPPPSQSPSDILTKLDSRLTLLLGEGHFQPSASLPEENLAAHLDMKTLELSSETLESRVAGSQEFSTQVPSNLASPDSLTSSSISHLSEPLLALPTNTENNLRNTEHVPSSQMGGISFFSAREKFLGLSQEDGTTTVNNQAMPRTLHRDLGGEPASLEEQGKEYNDGAVALPTQPQSRPYVRRIVTELESMSYGVARQFGPLVEGGCPDTPQSQENEGEYGKGRSSGGHDLRHTGMTSDLSIALVLDGRNSDSMGGLPDHDPNPGVVEMEMDTHGLLSGCEGEGALEIEVQLHQVALATPSLTKRSNSQAKLGCLELSSNDLVNWGLSPAPPGAQEDLPDPDYQLPHRSHPAPDDASKKQCVLTVSPACTDALRPAGSRSLDGDNPSRPPLASSLLDLCQRKGGSLVADQSKLVMPPISVATQPQPWRTHPLRTPIGDHSEKKQTSYFL